MFNTDKLSAKVMSTTPRASSKENMNVPAKKAVEFFGDYFQRHPRSSVRAALANEAQLQK